MANEVYDAAVLPEVGGEAALRLGHAQQLLGPPHARCPGPVQFKAGASSWGPGGRTGRAGVPAPDTSSLTGDSWKLFLTSKNPNPGVLGWTGEHPHGDRSQPRA